MGDCQDIRRLLCLGDSHLRHLNHVSQHSVWTTTRFEFCQVPGATALGLENPRSATNALEVYRAFLAGVDLDAEGTAILTCLGEVDCGFLIWYKEQVDGRPPDETMLRSIRNYRNFILDVRKKSTAPLIIMDALPPAVPDYALDAQVSAERRMAKVNQARRLQTTLEYNQRLDDIAQESGARRLNVCKWIVAPDLKSVRTRFLSDTVNDHHLSSEAVAPLLVSELMRIGCC